MLRISWTEHVTNEEVFNRANTKPTLLDGLLKRRLAFHGHLVRKDGITLDLMIGRLHGTRPRGRPRTTWLKDLATQANISYKEAITIPRDRKKWRSVSNPRRTPDEWVNIIHILIVIAKMRVRNKSFFPWGVWVAATKQNVRVGTFMTFLILTRHCALRNAIQILILIAKLCIRNKSCFPEGIWVAAKKQNVRVGMSVTLRKLRTYCSIYARIGFYVGSCRITN